MGLFIHLSRQSFILALLCLSLLFLLSTSSAAFPVPNMSPTASSLTTNKPSLWNDTSALEPKSPSSPNFNASSRSLATLPSGLGSLVLIYGDYVNEFSQEPTEVWEGLIGRLGYSLTSLHISEVQGSLNADLLIVLPNAGTQGSSFGISLQYAQAVVTAGPPVLCLGYGHEVLDQLWGFDPVGDFIPSVERYLWVEDTSLQIFTKPHLVPENNGRMDIYIDQISYDAYKLTQIPGHVSVLGTNFAESGAQLLWFRELSLNTQLYYWGLDRVELLNNFGIQFFDNLLLWLMRPSLATRLGSTFTNWQLKAPSQGGYWAVQGNGGFGYPLEPSIAFTYYVTDIVTTQSLAVNISNFGSWLINECYNRTLGWFEDLSRPQLADRCVTTGMGILSLHLVGQLDAIDSGSVGNYLASCQDMITGGFFNQQGGTQTSLMATRFAITALSVLNQLEKIDSFAAINYITLCQELNAQSSEYGGFYSSASGKLVASLVSSLDALITLDILDALTAINQTALFTFIRNCEDPAETGIYDTKCTSDSDEWIMGTGSAIALLDILDVLSSFNTTNSRNFLLMNQFPNGGWGRSDTAHDFHNSPDETWIAVQGLTLTGGLGPSFDNLTYYLLNCSTSWGGASEPVIFGDLLTGWQILSALDEVGGLSAINQTAFLSYLNYCWITARSSFGWHQLPPSVGSDTDVPTPDRMIIESATFGPLYHYAYSSLVELLDLQGTPWSTRSDQIRTEIINSQTFAPGYEGMFGLHHLYVGQETDLTFRFDGTCWSLIAHHQLGGSPNALTDASAALNYLQSCLLDNGTHQYFHDLSHQVPLPLPWRTAGGHLADTWLGIQAYACLDPTLTSLNGTRLATYATAFLGNYSSILTTFYATDILRLLIDYNLKPDALTLVNKEAIKTLLIASSSYDGLLDDSTITKGRWTPIITNLAFCLANLLNLLPCLELNPTLNLTLLSFPSGQLFCGDASTITITVNEARWGLVPENQIIQAMIFNTTFTNFTGPDQQGHWACNVTVPYSQAVLGSQNLTVTIAAPTMLPDESKLTQVCEVWGALAINTTYTPALTVPRNTPVNVTLSVSLNGGQGSESIITDVLAVLINENISTQQAFSHKETQWYETQYQTQALETGNYLLTVNVSAPFCQNYSKTATLTIHLRSISCHAYWYPSTEMFLGNQSTLSVKVIDGLNGSPLAGMLVLFFEESDPLTSIVTSTTGSANYSWTIDYPLGPRNFHIEVVESKTHEGWVSDNLPLLVHAATIITISPHTPSLFLGETLTIEVQVLVSGTDTINGTASLYWDGAWQFDFLVLHGKATITLTIPYSESPGDHRLTILFGHLDEPDYYAVNLTSIIIHTLQVITPTLTVTLFPTEILEYTENKTITLSLQLSYMNRSTTYGLIGEVKLQLRAITGSTLWEMNATTNSMGILEWVLGIPPPGAYQLIAEFSGQLGFAPASDTVTFTVHPPVKNDALISSLLFLLSLTLIIGGLLGGISLFFRFQHRTNRVINRLLRGEPAPNTMHTPFQNLWLPTIAERSPGDNLDITSQEAEQNSPSEQSAESIDRIEEERASGE